MENEKRLIYAYPLQKKFEGLKEKDAHSTGRNAYDLCAMLTEDAPTVDAVELPCKVGDTVWGIMKYNSKQIPKQGVVRQMFFGDGMRLGISVRGVCCGEWGKNIFATKEEVEAAIEIRNGDANG